MGLFLLGMFVHSLSGCTLPIPAASGWGCALTHGIHRNDLGLGGSQPATLSSPVLCRAARPIPPHPGLIDSGRALCPWHPWMIMGLGNIASFTVGWLASLILPDRRRDAANSDA